LITAAQKHAQRNRGTLFVEDGELVSVEAYPGDQFIMRIRVPKCAATARAGNFVHINCDAALPMRRPLSIMRTEDDCIDVLYKIVGEGLHLLADKRPGDLLSVLGPIGRPFEPSAERPNALLIGGGVGIPPMVFLAEQLHQAGVSLDNSLVLMGSEVPFPFEQTNSNISVSGLPTTATDGMPELESIGIASRLASLQNFAGCYQGYVTDLAAEWLGSLSADALNEVEIFACGPEPMLEAAARVAAEFSVSCQLCLEEFMACAVGGCAGCAVPVYTDEGVAMKRVCVDGPVFEASTIYPNL
jgi:dihydroorotate dehydrogenase electron transfer subunit